jgi:hypothetical protein
MATRQRTTAIVLAEKCKLLKAMPTSWSSPYLMADAVKVEGTPPSSQIGKILKDYPSVTISFRLNSLMRLYHNSMFL